MYSWLFSEYSPYKTGLWIPVKINLSHLFAWNNNEVPGGAANFIINEAKLKVTISQKLAAEKKPNFNTKSIN